MTENCALGYHKFNRPCRDCIIKGCPDNPSNPVYKDNQILDFLGGFKRQRG